MPDAIWAGASSINASPSPPTLVNQGKECLETSLTSGRSATSGGHDHREMARFGPAAPRCSGLLGGECFSMYPALRGGFIVSVAPGDVSVCPLLPLLQFNGSMPRLQFIVCVGPKSAGHEGQSIENAHEESQNR